MDRKTNSESIQPATLVDPESLSNKGDIQEELAKMAEDLAVDPTIQRRLLRKLDWCILPPLTIMYLCNALDKGNVGNAKTDGWDKDVGLVGNQYYLLVMIFYVPFCLFGTPISIFVKRFSAARVLPLMMVGFGSMSLFCGIAKNFSQIFAIRFFLGIFESAMLPGVVYYLSTFYKRGELASRIALFYAAAAIAGAFSGLIAFGVFHLRNEKHHAWQYLFWIEGAATIFLAIICFLWLPRSAATWWLLTDDEKEVARRRILNDSSVTINEKLKLTEAFRPFKDPLYWVWAFISLSFGVPLASVNNFLPQIVASLGYDTLKTNLYTVAPNVVGTVALLILAFSSDYFRERSIHICIPLATSLVGFIVLGSINPVERQNVAYFACFLLTMGASAPSVLVATWYNNNTPKENGRAVVTAVMVAIANASGLISTNVFRQQDEPKYVPALATSAAFGGVCLIMVASVGVWMRWENRRRDIVQGIKMTAADVPTEALGDGPKSPSFRYMY
ncbi:MFS general substrate transporter [Marasmius fiardii PR-910]|nr:MFS general substrate transporter [Marasmius fiardii PR-910]